MDQKLGISFFGTKNYSATFPILAMSSYIVSGQKIQQTEPET
jgi:hypothetical protein